MSDNKNKSQKSILKSFVWPIASVLAFTLGTIIFQKRWKFRTKPSVGKKEAEHILNQTDSVNRTIDQKILFQYKFDENLVIYNNKTQHLITGFMLLVFGGVLLWAGIGNSVFCILLGSALLVWGIHHIVQAFDKKPKLIVSPKGIQICQREQMLIYWNDISTVQRTGSRASDLLVISLKEDRKSVYPSNTLSGQITVQQLLFDKDTFEVLNHIDGLRSRGKIPWLLEIKRGSIYRIKG